ncbi:MAG: nucleotidyltransferase family protein [Lachnospiraceae bacterium]|nr:nucleotidyltransferase family protein [Lachnospiraceae bacterium]
MNVTAIIAEYNPIHNGHVQHIINARKETNADYMIGIMSPDHVQRGCPSIISKYERTLNALTAGLDLIVELPHYYSTGSLDYFSSGAVSLIKNLGVVNCISFGSECGDLNLLKDAAEYISASQKHESPLLYKNLIKGINYAKAINSDKNIPESISKVLNTPNNLLGTSYIISAKKLSFECNFHTTKRYVSDYHDTSSGALSSKALRNDILSAPGTSTAPDLTSLIGRIPEEVYNSLTDYFIDHRPISLDDYSLLLFYKLNSIDSAEALTDYLDVSDNLAHKILKQYKHAGSFSSLCSKLKSKDLVYSRINRSLMHILLDITQKNSTEYINDGFHYYIKPLGFKKNAIPLLRTLKQHSRLPIISKNADAENILKNYYYSSEKNNALLYKRALRMFSEGISAAELYNKTLSVRSNINFISEYEHSPVIL